MSRLIRYQVIRGDRLVGAEHAQLHNAVLLAASHDGHAARFVRDRHGFMSFYASRHPIPHQEYIPAPCDAFRPWSPLKDEEEAKEHVARLIVESGWLHFRHKDMGIVFLTYENNILIDVSENAPREMFPLHNDWKRLFSGVGAEENR